MNGTRDEKIDEIGKLFSKLYCFTSEEIDAFMAETAKFPDEGIDKLLALLIDGKKQQDDILARRVEGDGLYVQNLSHFLKKTTDHLKGSYEESEHQSAEKILNKL